MFEEILIIVAFIIGFYLGQDRSLRIKEKIDQVKNLIPKKQYGTPFIIDTEEIDVEKKEKKEEKEILDIEDAIKANEQP